MNGSDRMVDVLGVQLAEKLDSSSQTMVYAAMCRIWGYRGLEHVFRGISRSERKHVAQLTGRIMLLDGNPKVARVLSVRLDANVRVVLSHLLDDGTKRIGSYGKALDLAAELGDQTTDKMIARILQDEQDHVDWATVQLDLIQRTGLEPYQASVSAPQIRPHMQDYAQGERPAVLIGTVKGVDRHRYIQLHLHDADDQQRRFLPLEWVEFLKRDSVRRSKGADAVHSGWLFIEATGQAIQVTARTVSVVA